MIHLSEEQDAGLLLRQYLQVQHRELQERIDSIVQLHLIVLDDGCCDEPAQQSHGQVQPQGEADLLEKPVAACQVVLALPT